MIVVTRSAFVHVVGLLNTYLPLTVIVFVINVKWFTAVNHAVGGTKAILPVSSIK